jgi:transposase
MRQEFACEADARAAADLWKEDQALFKLNDLTIITKQRRINGLRGRPKKNEETETSYLVSATVGIDEANIAKVKRTFGRFILASNDLELNPDTMLYYYKEQQSVERGFRFLKDKRFQVSEVYLKKEERIEALAMVMVLCLMIYSFAEWKLRKSLKETNQSVPDQKGKPTQKPTMRWIFELFFGVAIVTINTGKEVHVEITNLTDDLKAIISLMGTECKKCYGLEN